MQAATVIIDGESHVPCMIISLSSQGFQLGLSDQVSLPRRFTIRTHTGEQREVRLDWQLGLVAEVLFNTKAARLERLAGWFQPLWKRSAR